MCIRVFSIQDLRDFFANEEYRRVMVKNVLDELVEWPSCKLVDLIIDEFIDLEEELDADKTYQALRHVWGLMEDCPPDSKLDYKFEKFLCERYGYRSPEDDRVVYSQEELDELLEAENERADVHS